MRFRKLALAVGLASTLGAQMASALGLGEIKLYSKLNEPLNAEIRLLQVKDLTKSEVLVELASTDDFKRAGIERVFFLTDLRFEVVLDGPAGPVIRVTSQKPVKEPYLNFLLESQWPNGRILREYTLLMDLPTFAADQPPTAVQSARTTPVARPPVQRPAPAPVAAQPAAQTPVADESRSSAPAAPARAASGDVYGPVAANDTLWEIALKVRPDRQYSVQQTMLAIQQLNPDAFINGNINLLREGQVLRVPGASDIDRISAQQAVSEVAQQNSAWSELSGTAVGPQLEGSKRTRPAASATDGGVSGRLTVGGAGAAESGQAGRASGGDSAALQTELASSLEELDSARRENAELKDRVAEMEEQIETMERLLEVSSEEFRALQQNIAARDAEQDDDSASGDDSQPAVTSDTEALSAGEETAALTATIEGAPAAEVSEPDAQAAEQTQAAAPAVTTTPAQPDVKARDTSRVVSSAPAPAPSFMDRVLDNIVYIGAGALALVLAGLFFMRRRKAEQEQQAQADETTVFPAAAAAAGAAGVAATANADIDAAIESGVADDFSRDYDRLEVSPEDDLFADDAAAVEPQTGDAVAEADIYISYGKLDQAEALLNKALSQEPGNTDARMKLLEVFVAAKDLDKFDAQLGELMSFGTAEAIDRAEQMRQQFVGAPAFDGGDAADNEFALGDETLDLDLDLGDELQAEVGKRDEFVPGEDFGLRFASSLTSSRDSDDAATAASADEGLSLELDEALLAAEDDFLKSLDDGDARDSSEDLSFALTDNDEPLSLDFELDAADTPTAGVSENGAVAEDFEELDLELDALADEQDAFDLNVDDMDLAALDEEVSALSENIDFAGEEFGLDDDLSPDQPAAPSLAAGDNADEFGELALDGDFELDSLELGELTFATEDSVAGDGELTLDLDDSVTADLSDEVPTLSLADAEPLVFQDSVARGEATDAEPAELKLDETDFGSLEGDDFALFDETDDAADFAKLDEELAAFDENELEEFDLAADLGLDASDFASSDADLSDDDLFSEALEDLPTPEDALADGVGEDDLDAELDFLADTDEAATKLDLARAYIDMGDQDGAKDILSEVVAEGNEVQKQEAEELLGRLS